MSKMLILTEAAPSRRKRNPWAAVAWCVEHPFWPVFIGLGLLSIPFVFLGIHVTDGFIMVSFGAWLIMGCMLFIGGIEVIGSFFMDGDWDYLKRKVRERSENHGKIED